jgi:acylphosphatase
MMKIRKHFVFYGYVQGVGFRYRAYHAANMYGVTGYVRNCSDGSVEMETEGTETAIDNVILSIEKGHFIHIENMSVRTIELQNDSIFEIKDY